MARREMDGQSPTVEAEMAFLGSLILMSGNGEFLEAIDRCRGDWFTKTAHTNIFDALVDLVALGGAHDLVLLKDRLVYKNQLEVCGGIEYLASLVETVPSAGNWEIRMWMPKWNRRKCSPPIRFNSPAHSLQSKAPAPG